MAAVQRFQFQIDPKTPLKDLLPIPPKARKAAGPVPGDDLARVPEVEFEAPPAKDLAGTGAARRIAHQIAKVNHLNDKKADGFLEALRGERLDLAGLPFAMGDACRTKGERSRQFALAVAAVRRALQQQRQTGLIEPPPLPPPVPPLAAPSAAGERERRVEVVQVITSAPSVTSSAPVAAGRNSAETFWEQYRAEAAREDKTLARADRARREHVTVARIAALMQVLAPESAGLRLGLVEYLSTVAHAEATRALARLAIFSPEGEVRRAALEALKVRRERDYTVVLLQGLRYPWPAVARRAGAALVKLERTDLVPQLVDLLDEPDPRAPVAREVNGKRAPVVRELVRVNHHRNCLLCHAPGNTGRVAPEAVTAAVPVPGEPLPSPSEGYRSSSPDLLVRVDVTYLRQDFSALLPVEDANPWPEMQRFDFLVRTRAVTEEEAAAFREQLGKGEPDRPSPYHRAVLAALRELTGRDAEPTPEAWRRLLKLPAQPRRTASAR
jgi:hypothetical protein